jgi:hypothetical protein
MYTQHVILAEQQEAAAVRPEPEKVYQSDLSLLRHVAILSTP